MAAIDVPHFRLPFDMEPENKRVAETEQDTFDDVACCVHAILVTPIGHRDELPEFGSPNPTFTAPLDERRLQGAVDEWEPRAEAIATETTTAYDEGLRRSRVTMGITSPQESEEG